MALADSGSRLLRLGEEVGCALHLPTGLLDSVRTLTANIAAELGEAPAGSDHYRVLFLTGTLLFLITFVVNLAADLVVRGIRRQ